MGLIAALYFTVGIRFKNRITMKLFLLTILATTAMAEPGYPAYPVYPGQLQWPTLSGSNFASTCFGCRTKRSADPESDPEAQLGVFPVPYHNALNPYLVPHYPPIVPTAVVPAAPTAPVAPAVVPTYLHGVHTVASALDLKKSVPVPVGAPAPKYGNIVVPTYPAAPVAAVPAVPVAPYIPAVHYPVYPAVLPAAPVAPAAPVVPVTPVKVGAGVHPEGILGHVSKSPEGLSDYTRLNLFETHIPVLSALPEAEQYLAETKRRKRAVGDEFYENFFALHGEYPKAFVSGPGIYGVGVQGISTVYDVRSSPFGSIG